MGEQHLDALAVAARLLERLGLGKRTGDVAGVLIDAARDLARRLLRTASHLERAHVAVELARPYSSWSSFTILPVVVRILPAGHV